MLLVVAIERVSTMQLFIREVIVWLTSHNFPQTAPTDDAEKLTVSHTVLMCSKQYLHNTKREDLTESTNVMPAKYPPKVKLELLTTLECQSWGKLCIP